MIFKGAKAIKDIGKRFNGGKARANNTALITLNAIIYEIYELFLDTYKFPTLTMSFIFDYYYRLFIKKCKIIL